ncbi:MAG: thiol peroxidase [Spartobacteria bacterium]|nr:thiol peroxidase [Spartobacteria bacterium]
MATTALEGNSVQTCGELPATGSIAPAFALTKTDLSDVALADWKGKIIVLNVFPSVDTPVCAASVRRFNAEAAGRSDVVVLCVSMDLPFAHARFCGAEGLENVESLSAFRNPAFAESYGLGIVDSPVKGLLARAVIIIDEKGVVKYTELVPEITQEPDYASALASL